MMVTVGLMFSFRTQGLSWALRYVQQKEPKQTEDIQGTSEAVSVSLEPQEVVAVSSKVSCGSHEVASGSHKKTSGFYKAPCGFPEAVSGSSEATPGFPEAAPGSHEIAHGSSDEAFESSEAVLVSLQTAPESLEIAPEPSLPAAASSKSGTSNTDDESTSADSDDALRYFLDEMAETDRQFWKKYHKEMEEKALQESLQEKPTGLSQLKAACQATLSKAAASLQKMLLPLTAIHILNMAFPGATGTVSFLLCLILVYCRLSKQMVCLVSVSIVQWFIIVVTNISNTLLSHYLHLS